MSDVNVDLYKYLNAPTVCNGITSSARNATYKSMTTNAIHSGVNILVLDEYSDYISDIEEMCRNAMEEVKKIFESFNSHMKGD